MRKRNLTINEVAARGGRASQAKRTPEQRSELARRALAIRWARYRARKAKEHAA